MNTCWECGKEMQEGMTEFTDEVNGEKIAFKTQGLFCDCGYKTVASYQMKEYDVNLADVYRKKHGLLTTEEIKWYRTLLKMTQKQFADLLGVHVQSVKRWENGHVQDIAMDNLIRLQIKNLFGNSSDIPEPVLLESDENFEREDITAKDVADYIIYFYNQCGEGITHIKLQKLLYYVQAWFMAFYDKPLYKETFEAWQFGPVCNAVYHNFKDFGTNHILYEIDQEKIQLPLKVRDFVVSVIYTYAKYSACSLVEKTHNELPWKKAWQRYNGCPIENENIIDYYKEKLKYLKKEY